MSKLFSPFAIRGLTLRNRTVVSPMCQYTAVHGVVNDWHFVHLGRFALGGFGLVFVEATGVLPEGRISYGDVGLWNDAQRDALAHVARFLKAEGAAAGIQLGHAGRKAATPIAWRHGFDETEEEKAAFGYEDWQPVAPSPIAHSDKPPFKTPAALDKAGIVRTVEAFAAAATRSDEAGFDVVEIHGAHGYLIHEFLSPLANRRTDEYGGSRQNRMRFLLEIVEAMRPAWPEEKPLFVRISATDGSPGGWDIEDSVALARELGPRGVDVVDCSSGGFDGYALKAGPLYQLPLSVAVRRTGIATATVGLISDPQASEAIIEKEEADLIALARGALEDPNWAIHARHALEGGGEAYQLWPRQARNRIRDKDRVLGIRSA
jgi:2,4-dienoyl-CoA reductase-like NADH-dependent reductase (Old Yellow Enzyme family)